jgi:hypothetical protein
MSRQLASVQVWRLTGLLVNTCRELIYLQNSQAMSAIDSWSQLTTSQIERAMRWVTSIYANRHPGSSTIKWCDAQFGGCTMRGIQRRVVAQSKCRPQLPKLMRYLLTPKQTFSPKSLISGKGRLVLQRFNGQFRIDLLSASRKLPG